MPLLVDETIGLLFGHLVIDEFGGDTEVEKYRVFHISICPVESLLKLATWSKNPSC